MKGYTVELKKVDDRRSLVLWVKPSGKKQFVVCSFYHPWQPVGQQWDWGHYFESLDAALEYIEDTKER